MGRADLVVCLQWVFECGLLAAALRTRRSSSLPKGDYTLRMFREGSPPRGPRSNLVEQVDLVRPLAGFTDVFEQIGHTVFDDGRPRSFSIEQRDQFLMHQVLLGIRV